MSSKKTKYLNMHDWIGTDPWRRSEISENFQKLDDKSEKLDLSMAAATNTAGQAKATAEGIEAKAESALSNSTAAVSNANTAVQTASAADVKATAAKTTAEDALTKAQSADATAASVQNQFDQVVINGDSSIEAAQARVDTNGQTYTTLKQRLDSEFQQTTATLAETEQKKADISYVDTKVQASNIAWKESYATLTALQSAYPTGDTFNHTVLADNMIYSWANGAWTNTQVQANGTGVAPNSIDPAQTTFFKKSTKNLLNPSTTKAKTKIDTATDGREQVFNDTYAAYRASDFIPALPNTQYTSNMKVHSVVFFNASKVFNGSYYEPGLLPERISAGLPFTTPANTAFYRLNLISDTNVNDTQVEQGNKVTTFEPYFIPPSYIALKSIDTANLKDDVLGGYATIPDLDRVEAKTSISIKRQIPNDFKRWKLLDSCTKASEWTYDATNSTAAGNVAEVSQINTAAFPASASIPAATLKPWLFSEKGAMAGLSGTFGDKMLKFEATTNGHAFFHRALPEREDFSQKGEMAFAVWIDSVSTDADEAANIQQTAYHNYPANLTQYHRASDAYASMSNGKGTWAIVVIPSIRKQLKPIIWVQAGSSPYGIQTLATTDGIGFRVTNSKTDGKVARVYVSGIFRMENTLDKGKLIITFDDGFLSQYQEAYRYMYDTYGYKANIAVVGSWIKSGVMGQFPELPAMTVAQMKEVEDSGWDIVSHTWSHVNLGFDGYTPLFIYNEIQKNHQWLIDNGIKRGSRFLMYPEGSWNKTTLEVIKQFHALARTTSPIYMQINPTVRQHTYPSIDSASLTEAAWRDLLQTLQDHKGVASRHFHHIGTGGWNPIDVAKFKLFIDIIKEYNVDVITWSEFYENHAIID